MQVTVIRTLKSSILLRVNELSVSIQRNQSNREIKPFITLSGWVNRLQQSTFHAILNVHKKPSPNSLTCNPCGEYAYNRFELSVDDSFPNNSLVY